LAVPGTAPLLGIETASSFLHFEQKPSPPSRSPGSNRHQSTFDPTPDID
jgi:hypothetical protein